MLPPRLKPVTPTPVLKGETAPPGKASPPWHTAPTASLMGAGPEHTSCPHAGLGMPAPPVPVLLAKMHKTPLPGSRAWFLQSHRSPDPVPGQSPSVRSPRAGTSIQRTACMGSQGVPFRTRKSPCFCPRATALFQVRPTFRAR